MCEHKQVKIFCSDYFPDPYGIEIKRKRKEVNMNSIYNDKIPMTVMQEIKGLCISLHQICVFELLGMPDKPCYCSS